MKDLNGLILLSSGLLVGLMLASQAAINAQLKVAFSSPIHAALISFLVGTLVLAAVSLCSPRPWLITPLNMMPWWVWIGGFLGAFNIAMSIFLAPRLGALSLAACIICGQLIASALFDHFGWLGYAKTQLTLGRISGIVFLFVGMLLVMRK